MFFVWLLLKAKHDRNFSERRVTQRNPQKGWLVWLLLFLNWKCQYMSASKCSNELGYLETHLTMPELHNIVVVFVYLLCMTVFTPHVPPHSCSIVVPHHCRQHIHRFELGFTTPVGPKTPLHFPGPFIWSVLYETLQTEKTYKHFRCFLCPVVALKITKG